MATAHDFITNSIGDAFSKTKTSSPIVITSSIYVGVFGKHDSSNKQKLFKGGHLPATTTTEAAAVAAHGAAFL